jgi:hypothetical protein
MQSQVERAIGVRIQQKIFGLHDLRGGAHQLFPGLCVVGDAAYQQRGEFQGEIPWNIDVSDFFHGNSCLTKKTYAN